MKTWLYLAILETFYLEIEQELFSLQYETTEHLLKNKMWL